MGKQVISEGPLNFRAFVAAVYDLSEPRGEGLFSYRPGPIAPHMLDHLAEEAEQALGAGKERILDLDYVMGRACKITLYREPNGHFAVDAPWLDHTPEQLLELVHRLSDPKHYLPGKKGSHFFSDYERPAEFRRDESPTGTDSSPSLAEQSLISDVWMGVDLASPDSSSPSDSFSGGGGDFGGGGSSSDF